MHAIVTMSNFDIYIELCMFKCIWINCDLYLCVIPVFLWRVQRQVYRVLLLCIHTQTDKSSRHVRLDQHDTSLSQTTGPRIPAGSCPEYQSTVLSCLQSDYTQTNEKMTALIKHTPSLPDAYGYMGAYLALTKVTAVMMNVSPAQLLGLSFTG